MSTVVGVSAAAVLAAVCGLLLKKTNRETALLFSVAASTVIFIYLLPQAEQLTAWIDMIGDEAVTEILSVMVRALGIVLTAHAAVHVCKDAGENALALGVDFAAKLTVLLLLLPVLRQFLDMIREVLLL